MLFNGDKLISVRELNGLSRKELADKINVSEQAIWQYENQYTVPKLEVVNELKRLFLVKAQYFYTDVFVSKVANENQIAYRSEDRDSRKKTKMEKNFVDFVNTFISQFEQYLIVPDSIIHKLRDQSIAELHMNRMNSKEKKIELIASLAREVLGVKDNNELLFRLEKSGVYVLERNLGFDIDAYSTWTSENKAYIVLGNLKKSSVRRNFDLAHELGHLLMHYKVDMDELSKSDYKKLENEANLFASFFLLPEKEFTEDFYKITRKTDPDAYMDLKEKWHVSIIAMEYRAYNLGLLSYKENRYFYASLNRKKYRSSEPLDNVIPLVKPGMVRSLFEVILENGLTTLEELEGKYEVDIQFFEHLFTIESSFFERFKNNKNSIYFTKDNIIQMGIG